MLAYYYQTAYKVWNGEPINGKRHPLSIENLWSEANLNAAGLFKITPFTVPEGKVTSGNPSYTLVGNKVVQSYSVVDAPVEVPEVISDRQFAQQLRKIGMLTHTEALNFVKTGTIPAQLSAFVSALPTLEQRQDAEMLLSGAIEFQRHHELTMAIAAAMGWTDQQVDDLWVAASLL